MKKSKLILIISSICLVVILLFLGIYNFIFKKDIDLGTPKNKEEQLKNEANPETITNDPKLMTLIQESVNGPTLSKNGENIKYYNISEGRAYEFNLKNRNSQSISDSNFKSLEKVFWSPEKTKSIIKTAESFYSYDYLSKESKNLGSSIKSISWNTAGDKILYVYQKEGQKNAELSIADPDGSNWKKIIDFPHSEFSLSAVPNSSDIAFWGKPDSYYETSLKTIPSIGGEEKIIFTGKFGADYVFSPNGETILLSHSDKQNGSKIQLATINKNGGEYQNLNIATFVSKCVWSKDSKTVYFALPGQIPVNSQLPEEYNESKFFTADTFWKIDIESGKSERLLELSDINEKIDAKKLFLSNDESQLFFVNRINNKLYKIELD